MAKWVMIGGLFEAVNAAMTAVLIAAIPIAGLASGPVTLVLMVVGQ